MQFTCIVPIFGLQPRHHVKCALTKSRVSQKLFCLMFFTWNKFTLINCKYKSNPLHQMIKRFLSFSKIILNISSFQFIVIFNKE